MTDRRRLHPDFDENAWTAPPELARTYRVSKVMQAVGAADMRELWARAEADPEWWYPTALDLLGWKWMRPPEAIRGEGPEPFRRWFVGAGTNIAWAAVDRWMGESRPAIIWESEEGDVREVGFPELDEAVRRAAAGLRRLGVRVGDVVAMHLPVVPEALVAKLAVARIGAIVAPAFSGYGVDALQDRLALGGARVLITADGALRRGKRFPMLPTAIAAADAVPSVEHIVVFSRLGEPLPAHPRLVPWDDLVGGELDGDAEAFDADTPWLLMFTSGSTGKPKGTVHTHGGLGPSIVLDLGLTLDVRPGDRFTWPADMGWLAGAQAGIGALLTGATSVLYDGVVDRPKPNRIWELVERHRVTQYGLAPTTIRLLAAEGEHWVEPYELATLRLLVTSGEKCTPSAWRWLHRHVGRGWRPIINWTGGTEIGGPILTGYPNVPTYCARFSGPNLGMAVDVVDETGNSVGVGETGELVLRRSWPSMSKGLWNEPERYLESYWEKIPGVWVQGDFAVRYEDGSFDVPGRSDDVFKIAGKRVGPSEIEALAVEVPGVVGAAAVGIPHETKGEAAVVCVQVDASHRDDPSIPEAVADHVAASFGKPMRPEGVFVVDALPQSRNGKIMRRVLKAWILGREPGDVSSLENPEAADAIVAASAPIRDALRGPD